MWIIVQHNYLKGTLDMCLLALLAQQPRYGYEIVRQLTIHGLDLVSEGSIYPLLSRLQQHGYIEGYLVASMEGPRRKYYRLLPAGVETVGTMADGVGNVCWCR